MNFTILKICIYKNIRHPRISQMPYRKCVSSILYCNFYPTSKNHPAALVLFSYNLIQKATPKLLSELHLLPIKVLQIHDEVFKKAALILSIRKYTLFLIIFF